MERPSHTNFHLSQPFSSRFGFSVLAISLPLTVLWALTLGMAAHFIRDLGPLVVVPVDDAVKPKLPPLDPRLIDVKPVTAVQPDISFDPQPQANGGVTSIAVPPADNTQAAQPAGPDQAPVGIAATHTRPPYPLLAQRMGAEGRVTLRLTVLADGRVGGADIVSSSGRSDLDETARDWIMAHWAYRPAVAKGEPVAGQTLVTISFSLRDQH